MPLGIITAAVVKLNTVNLIQTAADSLVVANAAVGANQAVGGFIAVTGSNNKYSAEVDQLLDPSQNKASANVQTIGDENGVISVWDLKNYQRRETYSDRGRSETESVAMSPDGAMLAAAGTSRQVVSISSARCVSGPHSSKRSARSLSAHTRSNR